jgi:lipoyl(octanoyl) transferase
MNKILHTDLGLTDYFETWQLQKELHKLRTEKQIDDILITTEHNHVYTLGKAGDKNHLLLKENELKEQGISFFEIDRGGDLTYHGPGQLVAYPIFDLTNYYKDSHKFLRDLEETVILTLKDYGIEGTRDEGFTGVWVNENKICAIGIKISRWVTMHGLALNVNNTLDLFGKIIPCGIFHKGVTSIKQETGNEINMETLIKSLIINFQKVFSAEAEEITPEKLKKNISFILTGKS